MLKRAFSWSEPLHTRCSRLREELGLPESLSMSDTVAQAEQQLGIVQSATPISKRINACLSELGLEPEPPMGVGLAAVVPAGLLSAVPVGSPVITAEAIIVDDDAAASTIQHVFRNKHGLTTAPPQASAAEPIVVEAVTVEPVVVEAPPRWGPLGMPPQQQAQAPNKPAPKPPASKPNKSPAPKAIAPPGPVPVSFEQSGNCWKCTSLTGYGKSEVVVWLIYLLIIAANIAFVLSGCCFIMPFPIPLGLVAGFFVGAHHWGWASAAWKKLSNAADGPKLENEAALRAYATKMQNQCITLHINVETFHYEKRGSNNYRKTVTVYTHRSKHIFNYKTCTDESKLVKNWYTPSAGVDKDVSLDTSRATVVQSGLTWATAAGETTKKLAAEKARLYDAWKKRDRECRVTVVASLPGRVPTHVYLPTGAEPPPKLQLPGLAMVLLWLCGLGLPMVLWRETTYFRRRIDHRVHKVISLS